MVLNCWKYESLFRRVLASTFGKRPFSWEKTSHCWIAGFFYIQHIQSAITIKLQLCWWQRGTHKTKFHFAIGCLSANVPVLKPCISQTLVSSLELSTLTHMKKYQLICVKYSIIRLLKNCAHTVSVWFIGECCSIVTTWWTVDCLTENQSSVCGV